MVLGAGAAGGTAAYYLAKRGRSVLLLERDRLPRHKPCAGGVAPTVQRWFDFDLSPAVSFRSRRIRYTWQSGDPQDLTLDLAEPFWIVNRDAFDALLAQQAARCGAVVRDGLAVTGLQWLGDRWQVQTTEESCEATYLIAADGATGAAAGWLGLTPAPNRACVAFDVTAPVEADAPIAFDFGTVEGGYLWRFPKAEGYSIGVGTLRGNDRQDLEAIGRRYLEASGLGGYPTQVFAHRICPWQGDRVLHGRQALIAGDAAGVADPFTAEGIRPALLTGMLAAEAIEAALAGDGNALATYTQRVRDEWGADMVWAQRLAGIFYRLPGFAYKVGIKRPGATKRMGRIVCGEDRYRDVAKAAIDRLMRGLLPGKG